MPRNVDRDRVYSAYLSLFDSDPGRIVLEDLRAAFCDLSFEPGAMDYKAGQADVVHKIERTVEIAKNPPQEDEEETQEE